MDNPMATADENKPHIDMQFNSDQEAYDFYNSYGGRLDFSVRREYINKSKKDNTTITSRRFACNKHGIRRKDKRDVDVNSPRVETRTDCPAHMGIMLENEKYRCHDFVEDHNHEL
ncbi:protein FAR1-RELATED SEQUENCE 5-like [Telopea speciosissima]|uniref:protein FAR1-RELATED SEQUENCE 5-like n=1 Tax=Telopea speciosissima TaxID=54955 RepID=UPI001CC4AEAD|nr:protein FAR1-RELATED SEQUENCE 5-like [Telopea speciosissima]